MLTVKRYTLMSWINDKFEDLKKLQKEAEKNKLRSVCSCIKTLSGLLNSIANMNDEDLYLYEMKCIVRPAKVYYSLIIEEIKETLDLIKDRNGKDADKYQDDINRAVNKMINAYNHIINAVANNDRQLFTGFPVDNNLYDISPKLLAYCADILYTLIDNLLDNDNNDENYSFILYPSIDENVKTRYLFDCIKKKGRVVVIYISESKLWDLKDLPIYLVHEAFHVIANDCRLRKLRALKFCKIMNKWLENEIHDMVFPSNLPMKYMDDERLKAIEKKIFKIYSKSISKLENTINTYVGDEKAIKYYADSFTTSLKKAIVEGFRDLNTYADDFCPAILDDEVQLENESNGVVKNVVLRYYIIYNIRNQLFISMIKKKIDYVLNFFKIMFRECFADVAMVILLSLPYENYINAMDRSVLNFINEKYDQSRYFRIKYVYESTFNHLAEDVADTWKNGFMRLESEYKEIEKKHIDLKCKEDEYQNEEELIDIFDESKKYDDKIHIKYDALFSNEIVEYLQSCSQLLVDLFSKSSDSRNLMRSFYELMVKDDNRLFNEILFGSDILI